MRIDKMLDKNHKFYNVYNGRVYASNDKELINVLYTIRKGYLYSKESNGKPIGYLCYRDNTIRNTLNNILFTFNKTQFIGMSLPEGCDVKLYTSKTITGWY